MLPRLAVLLGLALLPQGGSAATYDPQHTAFTSLLQRHVSAGRVDYTALRRERASLDAYVAAVQSLDAAMIAALPRPERLAFHLNAYNAFVLRTIVDHHPLSRGSLVGLAFPANSIWQIPGAFRERRFTLGGKRVSLDDLEHRIIRPQFAEPRVHMALVCAARSCPPLRSEAFVSTRLDAQLDDQAQRFLADRQHGLQVDAANDGVRVSAIFKWFGEDFAALTGGDRDRGVLDFVAGHVDDAALRARLRAPGLKLRFLDYDWTLNE